MDTTAPHAAEMATSDPDLPREREVAHAPTDSTELTIAESVASSLTGMVIGGAAIWFLAPICFNC